MFITFILGHLPHGMIGLLDRRVLRRHALVEGRRAERAGVDDDGRFLSAPRDAPGRRRALRRAPSRWFTVMWGVGRGRLRALREPGGEPDPGGEHRRLDLLRRGARPVPRGVLPAAGAGDRRLLGGDRGAAPGVRALRQPGHQLPLVQPDRLRGVRGLQPGAPGCARPRPVARGGAANP